MDKDDLLALLATDPDVRAAVREVVGNPDPMAEVVDTARRFRDDALGRAEVEALKAEQLATAGGPVPKGPPPRPAWIKRRPHERA